MPRLSNASLKEVPEGVSVPKYDRSELSASIVHIGVGNFHRAHQSFYLHQLMQQGKCLDWAIVGAGVKSFDRAAREKFKAQDCLSTLIELCDDGSGTSSGGSGAVCVVGSMVDYVAVDPDNLSLIELMAEDSIRIVGLTVTEGGYFCDPATKEFDSSHAEIVHDVKNRRVPSTAFGAIVEALDRRRRGGKAGLTLMSCDNLQGNGAMCRQAVVSFARLCDPELAAWIEQNCSFPNSMVDCIVPATGPDELELCQRSLGTVEDLVPVTHEDFRQWVIEDKFVGGRPDWDLVGVTFTDDVEAYETMKIRLLNGGHQVIADVAEVLGVATIHEAVSHKLIRALLVKVLGEEIAPHVAEVPSMTPTSYIELLLRRFSNSRIKDTTRRVAFDGSSRHPGFLHPSIRDGLAKGVPVNGLALVSAAWARYCLGEREDGSTVEPNDPNWDLLQERAKRARSEPRQWLEMRRFYGDLAEQEVFADSFEKALNLIYQKGMEAAISSYIEP